jgi:hypothetical protein
MKINPLFEPSQEEIDALVSRYPLAPVISAGAAGLSATSLPLLLERGAYGSAPLIGHFDREPAVSVHQRQFGGPDRISGAARIHFAILVHRRLVAGLIGTIVANGSIIFTVVIITRYAARVDA